MNKNLFIFINNKNMANEILSSFIGILLFIFILLIVLKKLPLWTLYVFLINFFLCLITWEIWMSYGLVNGKSTSERNEGNTNDTVNMILMSLGDGLMGVLQIYTVYKLFGNKAFNKWDWRVFGVIFSIGVLQNIVVTAMIYKKINNKKISWAPLMPIQTNSVIQIQEPWIIQPFIIYGILLSMKFIK